MTGIFGGSFNPVHIGHLILAEYIRNEFKLDRIMFIPANIPPHKTEERMESAQHRFNMLNLAIESNENFIISKIELNRKGPSYTVDTLTELSRTYSGEELYFICGADSLMNFYTWRNIGEIFRLAHIIIAGRAKINDEEFSKMTESLRKQFNARILISQSPLIDISSTQIRERIQKGLSIKYLVPDKVENYIRLHRLYMEEA